MKIEELKSIAQYKFDTELLEGQSKDFFRTILILIDSYNKVCDKLEWIESTINIDIEKEMENEQL